jgi:hypothetical protein
MVAWHMSQLAIIMINNRSDDFFCEEIHSYCDKILQITRQSENLKFVVMTVFPQILM